MGTNPREKKSVNLNRGMAGTGENVTLFSA